MQLILDELHVKTIYVNIKLPRHVRWEKATEGWLKLNVDDSYRDNLGSNGGGGII